MACCPVGQRVARRSGEHRERSDGTEDREARRGDVDHAEIPDHARRDEHQPPQRTGSQPGCDADDGAPVQTTKARRPGRSMLQAMKDIW